MPQMPERVDIGDIVGRVLRDHPGLTYEDFGVAAGVSGRQVSRWVAGESVPPARKVVRALEQLGIVPDQYGLRSPAAVRVEATTPPAWFQRYMDGEAMRRAAEVEQLKAQLDEIQLVMQRIARKVGA